MHDITIDDNTVNEFGSLYKAITPLLREELLLRVETLTATPETKESCNELFKLFTDRASNTKAIKLQVSMLWMGL